MDYSGNYEQQAYDPTSQIKAYDQSAQAYYSYHQYIDQQNHTYYSYTPHQQQEEPTPPGVPVPPNPQTQNPYYHSHGADASNLVPQQGGNAAGGGYGIRAMPTGSHQPVVQASYGGSSILDGRPSQGAQGQFGPKPIFRGHPVHGQGRGRGRHLHAASKHALSVACQDPVTFTQAAPIRRGPPQQLSQSYAPGFGSASMTAAGEGHLAPVWVPPRIAWCELCRVDCNTLEILEQHKNGKKHKKNLKVYDELQRLNRILTAGQKEQTSKAGLKSEGLSQPDESQGDGKEQLSQENLPSQAVVEVKPNEELAHEPTMNQSEGRERGVKRNKKGGRGGKSMRFNDGSRRPIEPPKPKEIIPLICELCNVKCESPITFQSHLMGKKHQSKAKRFQGHQNVVGQAAIIALYPALQALYPALQVLCQQNTNASTSLAPQLHSPSFPGSHDNLAVTGQSECTQGQVSAVESVSLLAMPPPSAMETKDLQTIKLQGLASESNTRPESSHVQPVSGNCEVEYSGGGTVNRSTGSLVMAQMYGVATGSELVPPPSAMETQFLQTIKGSASEYNTQPESSRVQPVSGNCEVADADADADGRLEAEYSEGGTVNQSAGSLVMAPMESVATGSDLVSSRTFVGEASSISHSNIVPSNYASLDK